MRTPNAGQKLDPGMTWAADTGCFSASARYSDDRYLTWLDRQPRENCLFATAPDVFNDGPATMELALPVLSKIRELGFKAALVAQPWITPDDVPWDDIDALFVGGPNEWQHSNQLRSLVERAKSEGKWVHMGRVNTVSRIKYAVSIGCDSADGTFIAFGPDRNFERLQRWMRLYDQPMLSLDYEEART